VFTNLKVWDLFREQRRAFREIPSGRRRRIYFHMTVIYLLAGAYFAVLIIAPLGRRNTFIYLLIVPFLTVVPLGVIATGIYGYRGRRRWRPSGARRGRSMPPS
jgi:hypothetical protein